MIHITDGQSDDILDVIPDEEYWNENHHKSLKDTLETFEFTTFADKRYSKYLTKRNRVIISDDDGSFVEFIIYEPIKYHDSNGHVMEVYARASYLEDLQKGKVIRPGKTGNKTNIQHANETLLGTLWEPGNVLYAGSRDFLIENFTNPYNFSKRLASEFELELQFRLEIEGNKIVGRYMDMVDRIGAWRGRVVEFGKDLLGIKRRETGEIVTALLGIGPEREDGTRLEVLVEDQEALQRWGRGQHIIEPYEPQSMDADMSLADLTRYTRTELNKRVKALIEYESTIANLESVPGLENQEIRFGDTIRTKDIYFNPPLYLEARIHTMDRSPKDKSKKQVFLGDYIEYTEEEVKAIWKTLQKQIQEKIDRAQLEEFTYTKTEIDDKDGLVRVYADTQDVGVYQDSTFYTDQQKQNLKNDIENGQVAIPTTSLEGAIELANIILQNASSTVYTDSEGNFYFIDGNNVVKITSEGIGVSSNGINGPFTNALTGQGLNATAIVTGILNADVVKIENGKVTIDGNGVSVKNGAFMLEDPTTGIKSILRENSNMIADHSFELLMPGINTNPISITAGVYSVNQDSLANSPWRNSNPTQARLMVSFDASTETLFGQRAAVLRGLDYGVWDQIVQIPAQYKHTKSLSFSAFVAPFELTTFNVEVSMRMQLVTKSGSWVRDLSTVGRIIDYTQKYNWTRLSVTYTGDIPAGDYDIRVRIFLNNNASNAYLLCDGMQLVPYDHPTLYYPETQVYRVLTGIDTAQHIITNNLDVTGYAAVQRLWVENIDRKAHAFANLLNGWSAYGGIFQVPRYTKTADGLVYLSGMMKGGLIGNYTAFVLPVGCRPNNVETFTVNGSSSPTDIYIYPNGDVRVINGGTGHVSLSGICFLGEK